VKRAGRAVELWPAPKARDAAHPQERQHTPPKAGRGTECARPELSVRGACAAPRQGSSTEWAETQWTCDQLANDGEAAPGATRLNGRPEGDGEIQRNSSRGG